MSGPVAAIRRHPLIAFFVGRQYQTHILLADVPLTQSPDQAMFAAPNAAGAAIVVPFGDGCFRAIAWDRLRETGAGGAELFALLWKVSARERAAAVTA